MIVLPNRFECYIRNLRIYTSLSIAKHGLLPRHIKSLRKITLCEAYLYEKELNVTAIKLLSLNLLSSVKTKKPSFSFSLIRQGTVPCLERAKTLNNRTYETGNRPLSPSNVMINKRLYIILLTLLSNNSHFLKISFNDGILIKGNGNIKNSLSVIKHLKGLCFFDIKTQKYLIFLPCEKTNKTPDFTESQWHFIYDKFSLLNLFLDKIDKT